MFRTKLKVRFNHVDAAGIVFYPRYYEMLNNVVEEWFEQKLGYDFRALNDDLGAGVPAVSINSEFPNACHLGDVLDFRLVVERLGNSSIYLDIQAEVNDLNCLSAQMTLIYVLSKTDSSIRSTPIPDNLRLAMLADSV